MTLREEKAALRAQYLATRRSISPQVHEKISHAVCDRFLALASYRYSEHILLYAPLSGELDIMPIAREALLAGKSVWFPRCDTARRSMTFHRVTDLESQLHIGAYGIREPDASLPVYHTDFCSSVCIVPAILFDRKGYRLGYGKGYYDRFLPEFRGTSIGAAASDFILDSLPHGRFDRTVDILLTEKGVNLLHAI